MDIRQNPPEIAKISNCTTIKIALISVTVNRNNGHVKFPWKNFPSWEAAQGTPYTFASP